MNLRRRLPLSLICTLLMAGVVRSTTVIPPTFESLVSSANTIFVGEVMNVQSEWQSTPDGRTIITLVTFRVADVWKGTVGAVTQLEFLGGTIDSTSFVVSGMPRFTIGQRDVLFVGPTVKAISPLVGFMHGRMKIERDINGVDRVRTFDGQSLASTAQLGAARVSMPTALASPMRLSDLATAVRSRINATRQR